MDKKIAINGFGRIGRTFFRAAHSRRLNIVAINDLTDLDTLVHLLKYDSTYGEFSGNVEIQNGKLIIDGKEINTSSEKDPTKLGWKKLGIDIVIESTGIFCDFDGAVKHLKAGAKLVIITAPAKEGKAVKTFVLGVNEKDFKSSDKVISMASCTTNCLVPVAAVIDKYFKIKKASMNTVHSLTMDQNLQDSPHKDLRRARSALQSIIPTTTGATIAAAKVLQQLENKMAGVSLRVPTATVSIVDFVAVVGKKTNKEEINDKFSQEAKDIKWQGALAVSDKPLVSVDFKAHPAGAIVDLPSTQVIDGDLIRVLAWYDNEMGYSHRLAEFVKYLENKI